MLIVSFNYNMVYKSKVLAFAHFHIWRMLVCALQISYQILIIIHFLAFNFFVVKVFVGNHSDIN